MVYYTDPLNPDTGGDVVSDGKEVNDDKTDPWDENRVKRLYLIAHYFTAPLISIVGVSLVLVKKFRK